MTRVLHRVGLAGFLGALAAVALAPAAQATTLLAGTFRVVAGSVDQHDEYLRHAISNGECYTSVFDDKGTTTTKLKARPHSIVDARITGHGLQITGIPWSGTSAISSDFQVGNTPVADPPPGCVGIPAPTPGLSSGCGTKKVAGTSLLVLAGRDHRLGLFGPLYDGNPFHSTCESDSPYASVIIPGAESDVTSTEVIEGKHSILHLEGKARDNDVGSLVSLISGGSGYHHATMSWKLTLVRVVR